MPWERELTGQELDLDCRIYLEKNMPDSALEVIPQIDAVTDSQVQALANQSEQSDRR